MKRYKDHRDIVSKWGYRILASDLDEPKVNVSMWHSRNQIPVEFWGKVVLASHERNMDITIQRLYELSRYS